MEVGTTVSNHLILYTSQKFDFLFYSSSSSFLIYVTCHNLCTGLFTGAGCAAERVIFFEKTVVLCACLENWSINNVTRTFGGMSNDARSDL